MNIGTDFSEDPDNPGSPSFSTDGSYIKTLNAALRMFGISAYQLGSLLGMKQQWQIYRALGRTKPFKKLSSKYALRLAYLFVLQSSGTSLGLVKDFNWDTGVIKFHDLKTIRMEDDAHSGYIPTATRRVVQTDQIVA